jgi:hypothetical protein
LLTLLAYEKFEWIKAGWRAKAQLKPSVGLAIANTTSNLALAIAIGQGVTIAWWRKAMNGATVSELHNSWSFSTSVLDLLTAGKGFNLIALAALTAKLALVDNLLLQQAAGDEPGLGEISNMPVRVPILDVLPSNYGGSWSKDGEVGTLSHPFSEALYGYSTFGDLITATIDGVENHCNGECFAMVPGFGFNISCTPIDHGAKNYSITPQTALNTTTAWRNRDTVDPDKTLFSLLEVSFSPSLVGEGNSTAKWSSIQMTTSWADLQPATAQVSNLDVETCNGRIRSQTCEFRPAKVLYPLQISEQSGVTGQNTANGYRITTPWWIRTIPEDETDDGADSYGILDKGQIRGVEVLETMSYDPAFDSNIQSFASMMNSMFAGSISLQYLNGTGFIPAGDGLSAPLVGTWWTQLTSSYSSRPKSCVMGLENPSTYIMSQLNSIALRVSIELAFHSLEDLGDAKIQQLNKEKTSSVPFLKDFKAKNLYPTVIYISHWPFLWAAIASLLLCVCLVLPSYWGFWQLGRKVTLGQSRRFTSLLQ